MYMWASNLKKKKKIDFQSIEILASLFIKFSNFNGTRFRFISFQPVLSV